MTRNAYRPPFFPLVATAIAIAILGLWFSREPGPPPYQDEPAAERTDYLLERFATTTYREDGTLEGTLYGSQAHHYPERGDLEVDTPLMEWTSETGDLWLSWSPAGVARENDGTLLLLEDVVIQRPATATRPQLVIETRDLLVHTRSGTATSDAPSKAYEPRGWATSVGLTVHFEDDRLELHKNARGRYEAP